MKTASVRQVQHRLAEVLGWVERGEEVAVTRRSQVVAKIVPVTPASKPRIDLEGRLRAIYPKVLPRSRSLSALIVGEREER